MQTTRPSIVQHTRPWAVRAAHKWYSWTGVALTVAGAYLAVNGQLRVGDGSQARAAGPEAGVTWKTAGPGTDASKVSLTPAPTPGDPFRAAPVAEPKVKPVDLPVVKPVEVPTVKPAEGPKVPDPIVAPPSDVRPSAGTRVGAVLEAYVNEKPITPVRGDDAKPIPPVKPAPLPPAGVVQAKPIEPRPSDGLPLGVGSDKLPPIPPPPSPILPPGGPEPVEAPKKGNEIKTLPVPPKPLNGAAVPAEEKKDAPPKKRTIIGELSREDEIKLNAAQNAARLRDFPRAAALMADVIGRNPNEYDLRAEYAGILLSAGDAKAAIRELEKVIEAAPNVAGYRILLGDAYLGARNFKGAAAIFQSTLEMLSPDARYADRLPEIVIRAARAYALDNDLFRAAFLVDKYLAPIRPDDPRAPIAMGAILLDLDRPYDALPYLLEKRKQLLASSAATEVYDLKVLEVLASMVRGFARVGDRQQAMDAIQELANRAPQQTGIRVALADILLELGEYELGGHVFNQVLAVDPANAAALIGIARVYLETFRPTAAKQVLDSFVPNAANQRGYLMTYSSYHQTVGEYTEAKQIYKDMLRRNEMDHEVRYALGRVYEYTKEWEKAKGEFAKIPPSDKMARRARLWFGNALFAQRKFAEAAQVAEQFLRDDPNNADGLALLIKASAKLGQFDKAVQAGRGYLGTANRDDRSAATVRLAVGRALLDGNRNLDAAREFEIAMSKPAGRVPEAYYGLSRAAEKLGNADRAHQIAATLIGGAGTDIRYKVAMADQYSMDFEDRPVIEIMQGLLASEPGNLAFLIRLADAQQRASRWPGEPADCFATCQTILRQSPTNVRGHLAMARSFAITQNYRKSSVQYDQLIAIDPEFTIPPRERARVLYSDKQFSAARTQYNVVLSPTPEEVVMGQMSYLVQRDPRMRQIFGPYLAGTISGAALRAELARIAASSPDEETRFAAHRMICDYDATLAWQETFRLERDAKELKGYRDYMAVPQYHAINQFEPTNTETLFDLGQVHGALKMTRAALTWYQNTLAVDPTHRESIAASERASAEISPKLDTRVDWFRQRGRDGLASIDRQRYTAAASLPLGDENEFLQFGYFRTGYNPLDDTVLWGNAPFLRVQKKFDDNRLMLYGQVNLEYFKDRFSDRPTFDVGYWYDHNDVLRTRGGAFLENVAENGESMRQDIFRYGLYAGADVRPTRVWNFGGTFTYAHYDDDNDAIFGFLYNEVSLSLPPKQLKLVQRVNAWSFSQQTQFPNIFPTPGNLRGTVHPYFAPDEFGSIEARIEWWHWLSRDYFVHSNQCWYSLQYGISSDKELYTYHDFRFVMNYDINSWVSIGAEARAFVSSVYDLYSAMGYLQIRFLGQ